MSAPPVHEESKDNDHRQQNVSPHPVSDDATPRPGILQLMRMMQRQKVQENKLDREYDQEWDLFCVLCEMLRQIIMNKMTCESPDEVDPFEKSFSGLQSDADRVKFIITHTDASCILKYFAREFHKLRQDFVHAFRKSHEVSTSYQKQGRSLLEEGKFLEAAHMYSQAIKFAPISDTNKRETCDEDWNELSRCHAERSECYFHEEEFAAAAADADLALASGIVPHHHRESLYHRKLLSLKSLGRSSEAEAALTEMEAAIKQTDDAGGERDAPNEKQEELLLKLKGILCQESTGDKDVKNADILQQIYEDRKVVTTSSKTKAKKGVHGLANASHKLRLDEGVGRGRFVTSTEVIEKDEVLIHESAVVSWLRPSLYQDYCFHCMKQFHAHFLVPCSSCALVAYCSITCRDDSWDQYHRHECRDLPVLRHLSKGHMVSRIILMRRKGQEEKSHPEKQDNGLVSLIEGIDRLISHSNDYSLTTSLETCLGAVLVSFLMQLLGLLPEHEIEATATSLLTYLFKLNVNCLQIVQQDVLILSAGDQTSGGEEVTRTRRGVRYRVREGSQNPGYGLYLTSSFLNHSCFNTTKSLFHGHELTFVSSNGFNGGEEITFNYGPHYRVSDRSERRKYLSDLYFFTCDCKACHEDWK